ncbi:MAG: type II toxin-antitoxin system VapC family toxin [Gemmatimonadetes bacterium]|jgi:hypothetical protein|nr:type II toxin-antitoxin system VapC family toxin [Gemmatimonadota bacterium]
MARKLENCVNEKPRIYLETSIVSYLVSRPSNDIRVNANQLTTMEWWEERRSSFDLYVSEFVRVEAALGDPEAAQRRIAAIEDTPELAATDATMELGAALLSDGPIPASAEIDAYHIAISAVNGMNYLLTWNCTHIANAAMRSQIELVCRDRDYEPPTICTPQELMEDWK